MTQADQKHVWTNDLVLAEAQVMFARACQRASRKWKGSRCEHPHTTYAFSPTGVSGLPTEFGGGAEGKQAYRRKIRAEVARLGASHFVVICECWMTTPEAARQECLMAVVGGESMSITTLILPVDKLGSAKPNVMACPNDGVYADLGGWASKRAVENATRMAGEYKALPPINDAQQQQVLDTVNRVRDRMFTSYVSIDEITDETFRGTRPPNGSKVMTPERHSMLGIVAAALGLLRADAAVAP